MQAGDSGADQFYGLYVSNAIFIYLPHPGQDLYLNTTSSLSDCGKTNIKKKNISIYVIAVISNNAHLFLDFLFPAVYT